MGVDGWNRHFLPQGVPPDPNWIRNPAFASRYRRPIGATCIIQYWTNLEIKIRVDTRSGVGDL